MNTEERVLVVPRSCLFSEDMPQGLVSADIDGYQTRIAANYRFVRRGDVENDPSLKQIIPYITFIADGRVFMTRRTSAQTESRLHGLYSIGIGGHINESDASSLRGRLSDYSDEDFRSILTNGLAREVREEVRLSGSPVYRLVGLINDDSTPVGSVHLGLAFIADVSGMQLTVRETELMVGSFATPDDLRDHYAFMETWSQIVIGSGVLSVCV